MLALTDQHGRMSMPEVVKCTRLTDGCSDRWNPYPFSEVAAAEAPTFRSGEQEAVCTRRVVLDVLGDLCGNESGDRRFLRLRAVFGGPRIKSPFASFNEAEMVTVRPRMFTSEIRSPATSPNRSPQYAAIAKVGE